MATEAALEAQSTVVAGFEDPKVSLEQYPTLPDLAAHLAHLANLRGDIEGATVLDLSSGTGMLGLGAALRLPARVVGIELDDNALATATDNARRVGASAPIDWIRADATCLPLCLPDDRQITVLMNPPFDAQRGSEHADCAFLDLVASIVDVSYSVHNEGSKELVESFAADAGGDPTDAFRAALNLDRQFDFHDEGHRQLDVEVFRIGW